MKNKIFIPDLNFEIPKILVIGNARHGKDSFVEIILEKYGKYLTFYSASKMAVELFIFDALKDKYNYKTTDECYNDRVNHRAEWHNLINKYNAENEITLTDILIEESDFYVGMRDLNDFNNTKRCFDIIVWVDASKRLQIENSDSIKLTKDMADVIIENNGSFEEFKEKVLKFGDLIYSPLKKYIICK